MVRELVVLVLLFEFVVLLALLAVVLVVVLFEFVTFSESVFDP